jgi:FlaA1/EpsC-like NDP-sugar epimerase
MSKRMTSPASRFFLEDVRDLLRLKFAMREVNYVINPAALKQRPAAEYNPMQCVKSKLTSFGTDNVIDAAYANGVERSLLSQLIRRLRRSTCTGSQTRL